MMFECPICHKRHVVQDNYDNMDYDCPNTGRNAKTFNNLVPESILTKNQFNMNKSSTLVDESRPVTIQNIQPTFRPNGEKIGQLKTNY